MFDRFATFPALTQEIDGKSLVYLDTAATALRPQAVIDAVSSFDAHENANPGAALHTLARRSHAAMEAARARVASFIGAKDSLEVIFTRGTTEGLNLVANSWGRPNLKPGPEADVLRLAKTRRAIPFDIDGATLSHRDDRCSFDAFLDDYKLDDPAVRNGTDGMAEKERHLPEGVWASRDAAGEDGSSADAPVSPSARLGLRSGRGIPYRGLACRVAPQTAWHGRGVDRDRAR